MPRKSRARGPPFQLPARLADGLGLESDPDHRLPGVLRPVPDFSGRLVPPRRRQGSGGGLGCAGVPKPRRGFLVNSSESSRKMSLPGLPSLHRVCQNRARFSRILREDRAGELA